MVEPPTAASAAAATVVGTRIKKIQYSDATTSRRPQGLRNESPVVVRNRGVSRERAWKHADGMKNDGASARAKVSYEKREVIYI